VIFYQHGPGFCLDGANGFSGKDAAEIAPYERCSNDPSPGYWWRRDATHLQCSMSQAFQQGHSVAMGQGWQIPNNSFWQGLLHRGQSGE
jgi:hypothetical protein